MLFNQRLYRLYESNQQWKSNFISLINLMIETLIVQFISCVLTTWTFNPEPCVDIINQIVAVQEQIEKENCEQTNCYWYTIWIKWFPYDSDANRVANYWYDNTSWDLDMISTFMSESMFNKDSIGKAWERGICQLQPNRTNNVWINDPRWSDIMYQAEVCMDKWKAVPVPSKIWSWWRNRNTMKDRILFYK